ncbi:RWD-domain-containing protein [Morchella conica CCBAS932]|uniref:RBR-type E3 ubiquitin transferase n=1 Tax=Morchella conica CCBAS932 TaxID=1392247 RepID=A0A3N4LE00_9PEZI|nr:RWD-domain-containing protein [Morchella conica CCBAS932]
MPLNPTTTAITIDDLLSSADERSQELATVAAIYPELHPLSPTSATIQLPVSPLIPVPVLFQDENPTTTTTNKNTKNQPLLPISHFPPLTLLCTLPSGYPKTAPPTITLSTHPPWLPAPVITRLQSEIAALWEDYGREQTVYTAIDHIATCAERAFDIAPPLALPARMKAAMAEYNDTTVRAVFTAGTYECGICLEPKKGGVCHRVRSCGHVFCRECLSDYFAACIAEGNVAAVTCSDQACVRKAAKVAAAAPPPPSQQQGEKSAKSMLLPPTLPPEELADIGISRELVKRYVDFKQKSALDADPGTVYCPRNWCQAPSRESIAALEKAMAMNHTTYYLPPHGLAPTPPTSAAAATTTTTAGAGAAPHQKLQVCSRCTLAFCRVCERSWHGDGTICRAPNAPLTAEELANEDYIKTNTTACPECSTPILKSHGCNHMICKCQVHFCFLCSAYLSPSQPFKHFNTLGTECYMRLLLAQKRFESR